MLSIRQKKLFKGQISAEIMGNERIKIIHSSLFRRSENIFNLFDLDSEVDMHFYRPVKTLLAAIILLLPSIPFLIQAYNNFDMAPLFVASLFVLPSSICFLMFFFQSVDLIVFRLRGTGAVAFTLFNKNPSARELSGFLEELKVKISSPRTNPSLSKADKLNVYAQHLEFLVNEEVLTCDEAQAFLVRISDKFSSEKAPVIELHVN